MECEKCEVASDPEYLLLKITKEILVIPKQIIIRSQIADNGDGGFGVYFEKRYSRGLVERFLIVSISKHWGLSSSENRIKQLYSDLELSAVQSQAA
jgi:hypothetical protein